MQPASANAAALDYLRKLGESRFWGSVTLKYEAGRVVHVRYEENLKPEELSEIPRYSHAKFGND